MRVSCKVWASKAVEPNDRRPCRLGLPGALSLPSFVLVVFVPRSQRSKHLVVGGVPLKLLSFVEGETESLALRGRFEADSAVFSSKTES